MSFESILQETIHGCRGAIGIALMSSDGIPIAQVIADTPEARALEEAFQAAGVEFGRVLDEVGKVSGSLGAGELRALSVTLERFSLVFDLVDDEIFVVMALLPDGNLGKARYLIRRHLLAIRDEL